MKTCPHFVAFLVLSLGLVIQAETLFGTERVKSQSDKSDTNVRTGFKLPKIFDFGHFKSLYGKQYGSAIEEMLKLRVFLARSYEVFVSAVAYLYRMKSYYLKLGERSDWLPEELGQLRNEYTNSDYLAPSGRLEAASHFDLELVEPEQLEEELHRIRAKADREPAYKRAASELDKLASEPPTTTTRTKRSLDATQRRADFSVAEAFAVARDEAERSDDRPIASNNPNWHHPELDTRGQRDFASETGYKSTSTRRAVHEGGRSFEGLPVKSNHMLLGPLSLFSKFLLTEDELARRRTKKLAAFKAKANLDGDDDDEVVWVDHRRGGCMQPVQNQLRCGSCYAFASIAFLEWLHCLETGKRVKFSEQYLIDCGPLTDERLAGCGGGNFMGVSRFVSNFGLELAAYYPYSGRRSSCPYSPRLDMSSMGYLRPDVSKVLIVDLKDAEIYLKRTPLLIDLETTKNFAFYGGGVYDGKDCRGRRSDHSMLLIGHGREDGEEFWLIRNSYGRGWGELGHMKLNKNSQCIFLPCGLILGTNSAERPSLRLATAM